MVTLAICMPEVNCPDCKHRLYKCASWSDIRSITYLTGHIWMSLASQDALLFISENMAIILFPSTGARNMVGECLLMAGVGISTRLLDCSVKYPLNALARDLPTYSWPFWVTLSTGLRPMFKGFSDRSFFPKSIRTVYCTFKVFFVVNSSCISNVII